MQTAHRVLERKVSQFISEVYNASCNEGIEDGDATSYQAIIEDCTTLQALREQTINYIIELFEQNHD